MASKVIPATYENYKKVFKITNEDKKLYNGTYYAKSDIETPLEQIKGCRNIFSEMLRFYKRPKALELLIYSTYETLADPACIFSSGMYNEYCKPFIIDGKKMTIMVEVKCVLSCPSNVLTLRQCAFYPS